jgi:ribosomal protein L37AE/L43A
MKMVGCPGCGKPLVKKSSKGRYYCESDDCPVIFVKRPHNPAIMRIIYKPSATENAIRKIEKTRMHAFPDA